MIRREEMQEITRHCSEPLRLVLGGHSALDIMDGARAFGMRRLVYAADMGKLSRYYTGSLGTQFISVDIRYETTYDGISRMHAKDQIKCDWSQSRYRETFAHGLESLRESLLRLIYPIADKFEKACLEIYNEPMIGAYCIQTLITFREKPILQGASVGVYDVAEGKKATDFEFVCQDIETRLGGWHQLRDRDRRTVREHPLQPGWVVDGQEDGPRDEARDREEDAWPHRGLASRTTYRDSKKKLWVCRTSKPRPLRTAIARLRPRPSRDDCTSRADPSLLRWGFTPAMKRSMSSRPVLPPAQAASSPAPLSTGR